MSLPGDPSGPFVSSDARYDASIDLAFDEIRHIVLAVGFDIVEERRGVPCAYTEDPESMKRNVFDCVFFVARKPGATKQEETK